MPSRNNRPASSRPSNRQNINYNNNNNNNNYNYNYNNWRRPSARPRFQSSRDMEAQQLAEGVLRALKSNEDDLSEASYRRCIYSYYDRCIDLLSDGNGNKNSGNNSNNSSSNDSSSSNNRGRDIRTATKTVQTILRSLDTRLGRYVDQVVNIERQQQLQRQTRPAASARNNNNSSRHQLHVLKQQTAALEDWLHGEFVTGIGRAVRPLCALRADLLAAVDGLERALDISSCDGFLRRRECERVMTEMRRREEVVRLVLARVEASVAGAKGLVARMMTVVAAVVRDGWLRHEWGVDDLGEWVDAIGKEVAATTATAWGVGPVGQEEEDEVDR